MFTVLAASTLHERFILFWTEMSSLSSTAQVLHTRHPLTTANSRWFVTTSISKWPHQAVRGLVYDSLNLSSSCHSHPRQLQVVRVLTPVMAVGYGLLKGTSYVSLHADGSDNTNRGGVVQGVSAHASSRTDAGQNAARGGLG